MALVLLREGRQDLPQLPGRVSDDTGEPLGTGESWDSSASHVTERPALVAQEIQVRGLDP